MHLCEIRFKELLVGRHARSLLNEAALRAERGDESLIPLIRSTPPADIGIVRAGKRETLRKKGWLEKNGLTDFDGRYTSQYKRATETTYHLDRRATWRLDARLNERNWGLLDTMSPREGNQNWPGWNAEYARNPFEWTPPEGESLSQKCRHVSSFVQEMNAISRAQTVFVLGHHDTNICIQMCIEGITGHQLPDFFPQLSMKNATLVHYRRDRRGFILKRTIDPHTNTVSEWRVVRR